MSAHLPHGLTGVGDTRWEGAGLQQRPGCPAHPHTSDHAAPANQGGGPGSLPCASDACCPEGTLQAPGSGWGVLPREAPD